MSFNIGGLWSDDITFCPLECQRTDCYRNQKNIVDKTIPHSYFMSLPEDCPKRIVNKDVAQKKLSSVEYLDWYFKHDIGRTDDTAVAAWGIIKSAMDELMQTMTELQYYRRILRNNRQVGNG